jgi:hypothetical protein
MRDDTFGDDDNRKPAATIEGEGLSRDLEKGDVEPPAYDRENRSRAKHSHKKRNHHQSRHPKGALPTNDTDDEMMIAADNRLSFAPASSGTPRVPQKERILGITRQGFLLHLVFHFR